MKKNDREKQMLYEWGAKNASTYNFLKADKDEESYFIAVRKKEYIREYDFETLPQFMEELNVLWGKDEVMGEIKKAVGAAAIKNKPVVRKMVKELEGENAKDGLPMSIYNF